MNYWLAKSEPEVFSIDDLKHASQQTSCWDGVRNYQARNYLKQMKINDLIFFYHSNCKIPGIVGIAKVVKEAYPDYTALDPHHHYFDPRSSSEKPIWEMVDVQFVSKFTDIISLHQLKQMPGISNLPLVRKGNRLSVMPVSKPEWDEINELLKANKKL
jgi:predicted RNA-binding protein with PUA-like domain